MTTVTHPLYRSRRRLSHVVALIAEARRRRRKRRFSLAVGAGAMAALAVGVYCGVDVGGGSPALHAYRNAGITVRYPAHWFVTNRPLDAITNPVQRFVLSSYSLPGGRPNLDGNYSPPPGQVIVQMLEDLPSPDPGFKAGPRPATFTLPQLSAQMETFGTGWGEIAFRDHARGFYIFIGVGRRASAKVALVLQILDGMTISAPLSVAGP